MHESRRSLRVLRLILAIRETSAPYNQFSLSWAGQHDITICTYFRSTLVPPPTIRVFEGDGSIRGFFRALRAAFRAKEYDVVHAHSPHMGLLFLIAGLFSGRRYASSTVVTVHDSYQNYKLRNRLMFLPVFAAFRRVVCCGRASYESFPALYRRLAGNRLCAVPNGLDISRVDRTAEQVRRQPRQAGSFTIIGVSRLVEIKNPLAVLAAFEQDADASTQLVYIGDGPLRAALVGKSQESGLADRITITGPIAREQVFKFLLGADLFISMSRGEGLPVAVLEAMACGCPVLLSDIPPHREIAEGVDFIPLVQQDDVPGFVQAIRKFRSMSASERAMIGQRCRKLVEQRFSLQAMQAGYEDIYAQITGAAVPSRLDPPVLQGNQQ